jgi:RHS repeat-associated protein
MQQDGNLRGNNQWYFYKYDILGRVIEEGLITDNQPLDDLQADIDASAAPSYEERCSVTQALPNGYTDQSYPSTGQTSSPILKLCYYDQYPSFVTSTSPYSFKPQSGFYQGDETVFDRLQGAVTTIKTRILESGEHWLISVNYYDIRARVIQTVSDNHLGGIDVICNSYNFDGSLQKTKIIHNYNAQNLPTETIQYRYNYDRMGRVLNIYQKYCESCDEITYASYKYNELGQLIDKNLHMPFNGKGYLQSIDYAYNPRGWLTRINQANLTNSNIYIQNEITCAEQEKIDGMRIDSIAISLKTSTDMDGVNYLNISFNDKKNLRICLIENPDSNRTINASEAASMSFSEDIAEQQQVYDTLHQYENNTYYFSLNSITFDENSETQLMLDSIASMISGQLPAKGVTNSAAREMFAALVRNFISDKVGIVFFNEDKNDLFGMEIHYDDGLNLQFNGNIASIIWQHRTNDPGQRRYTYQYDRCNRLRSADYAALESGSWGNNPQYGRYNINGADSGGIGYDDNGNILSLNRFGEQDIHDPQIGTPDYGQIDQLNYNSYKGNQLDALTDLYSDSTAASMPDFHDLSTSSTGEYLYDANGNMVRDDNKGITAIVYNHMNLPVEINFGANNKIVYLYDANGRKLMKQVIHNAQSHRTDYAGGFIYEDDLLKMILTPEGRIIKNSSTTYDPQYFIKDYLGNTRVVFHANATTGSVEVLQEDHYDPFGMKLGGLGMVADAQNKYLFQGKELNNDAIDLNNDGDPDTYLNWYDFEARNYDPQIGRWHVPDPVNQTASPYVSMGNNPVRFIDPDGCAYVGYGSLADRFYRSYYNDPNGHEGRLGPEGSIFTKVSPEDQSELAAMIEIGQAAGDDFHGAGDIDIANIQIGSSDYAGDDTRFSQNYKNVLNSIKDIAETIAKTLGIDLKEKESWKLIIQYACLQLKTSERVLAKVINELSYYNGEFTREVFAFHIKSLSTESNSFLILPSFDNIYKQIEKENGTYWGFQSRYTFPEMGLRWVFGSKNTIIQYNTTYYRILGAYHTHPELSCYSPADLTWKNYGFDNFIVIKGKAFPY